MTSVGGGPHWLLAVIHLARRGNWSPGDVGSCSDNDQLTMVRPEWMRRSHGATGDFRNGSTELVAKCWRRCAAARWIH